MSIKTYLVSSNKCMSLDCKNPLKYALPARSSPRKYRNHIFKVSFICDRHFEWFKEGLDEVSIEPIEISFCVQKMNDESSERKESDDQIDNKCNRTAEKILVVVLGERDIELFPLCSNHFLARVIPLIEQEQHYHEIKLSKT